MVDVTHDRDDRRPRNRRADVVGTFEQALFDVGFGHALDRMAHVLGDDLRGVGVERVGQRDHLALAHQELDDVDRALGHAVGEFLDGDRLRQHDLAGDLLLRFLLPVALQALRAAAEGGDRTRALLLRGGRRGDGQATAIALLARRASGAGVGNMTLPAGAAIVGRRMTRLTVLLLDGGAAARGAGRRRQGSQRRARHADGSGLAAAASSRGATAGSPPARRRRASSSDCRLKLASCVRRSSSSRLRASAASRSAFSRASRSRRAALSASWRRRSSSSRARASTSARARASRCSSVNVGSTTPVLGGARRRSGGRRAARRDDRAHAAAALGASVTGAARGRSLARRGLAGPENAPLLLDDDDLAPAMGKALPDGALLDGRFKCNVAFGAETPKVLSPLLFVSLMRSSSNPCLSLACIGEFARRSGRASKPPHGAAPDR